MGQSAAIKIIAHVTGPLVWRVSEDQNFLHAPIVSSDMGFRNMTTRTLTVKSMMAFMLAIAMHNACAVEKISLQALFKDKAIIVVDGKRRVLTSGQVSPEGVKLLATDTRSEKADIEIDGKREQLKLGVVVAGFASKGKRSATLYPDHGGHFFIEGFVNGASVYFLVDTGATVVAMNSVTATRVGIDYRKNGRPGVASTPAGYVRTYDLFLNSVQVGGITLYNVAGSVIEGNHPRETLLGMSFLGQLDMTRDGRKMELTER